MAALRTLIGIVLLVFAGIVAFLGIGYHGYTEDFGSTPGNTLWWAVPWAGATGVLAVLVLGAAFNAERRAAWSWLGLGFALVMALALVALYAWT